MIVMLPVSLLAQDTTAAILRSNGIGVQVNRNPAPASSALFSGDEIETQKNSAAGIDAGGSAAGLNPETRVQFEVNRIGPGTRQLVGHTRERCGADSLRRSRSRWEGACIGA
jgi:hypothetical protein